MEEIKQKVAAILSGETGVGEKELLMLIEEPPDPELGDLALPCFSLARTMKKDPGSIAEELKDSIDLSSEPALEKMETAGPYLNFFLDRDSFSENLIGRISEEGGEYGDSDGHAGEKVIIDMISTNPNKAPHIGHSRNACLGDTVSMCMRRIGYDVTCQSYSNDLGLPTAAVFWASRNLDNLPQKGKKREDFWQGEIYSRISELMKDDPGVKRKCNEMLAKLEKDRHSELAKEQREFARKCTLAQDMTWERLNVDYDLVVNESDIVTSGIFEEGIDLLEGSGYLVEGEGENSGCLLFKLRDFEDFRGMENPDKILVRPDGSATYTGKDIALTLWKAGKVEKDFRYRELRRGILETSLDGEKEGNFTDNDMLLWIIASEQNYVILADRYSLKVICGDEAFDKSHHISYGIVGFEGEAKISSREGVDALAADRIIDRAKELLEDEIRDRHGGLSEERVDELSELMASSAIRYYLLRTSPKKDIKFSFDEALSFEGEAGPYIQYSLVRAKNILKKSGKEPSFEGVSKEEEFVLVKELSKFPEVVEKVSTEYKPNILANYAFDLASEFSRFYERCPVIGSDEEPSRLAIVNSFAQVMENCIELLGMEPVEKM